jgi:hypothetical protein
MTRDTRARSVQVLDAVVSGRACDIVSTTLQVSGCLPAEHRPWAKHPSLVLLRVQVPVTVNFDSEPHGGLAAVTVYSGNLFLVGNDNSVTCVPKLPEKDVSRLGFFFPKRC